MPELLKIVRLEFETIFIDTPDIADSGCGIRSIRRMGITDILTVTITDITVAADMVIIPRIRQTRSGASFGAAGWAESGRGERLFAHAERSLFCSRVLSET